MVHAKVNERVSLRLQHVMLAPDCEPLLVVVQSAVEVLELAMNPADTIGHAWEPKEVTVPLRPLYRLVERCECFRHPSQISLGQAEKEKRGQQQKSIAQLRGKTGGLCGEFYCAFILGLEEIQAGAPG